MENTKYKSRRFLLPILFLVLTSIISIGFVSSYITINMFKSHMKDHIEQTKKNYTQDHKSKIFNEVNLVKDSIKFEITTIENKLKVSLSEKILIALDVAQYTYDTYKDTLNNEQIKEKIAKALEIIKFNNKRSYYFMYDNKTKVIFGHPIKKFIGKDMTNFKDIRGQNLAELNASALKDNKIGFNKIYFNKPNNEKQEFPKIISLAKFQALNLVIGIGEYLDVVEKKTKEYVLSRFSQTDYNEKDKYLIILDVHNMKGGDNFATVLLNSNRSELVGKKVSDKEEDIKGNKFRKDFLDLVVDKGEGYSKYWYKKPSTDSPALKISYLYLQKDWNWIIASGFYYEDLEKQITIMEESVNAQTRKVINKTLIFVILLSFLAILIAIFVSFSIDKTIKQYTNTIIDYEDNKRKQQHLAIQQSKMAAMGEMIGNIAHQWRQPLSIISTGATGAKIQQEMGSLSDIQLNSLLTSINDSAQYLSSTIDDFREFFNPTNDKVSEFNIAELFSKTLNLVKQQFNSKDIEIIQNRENFNFTSIENELIQVLINILNNAKDALVKIENQKRLIFINAYKNESYIVIEIKDNANGIPEDIIDRIFEPYFTTKHKSQGTGIGLYMSEEIVKNHLGGTIQVENTTYNYEKIQYTGTMFTIKIPKE